MTRFGGLVGTSVIALAAMVGGTAMAQTVPSAAQPTPDVAPATTQDSTAGTDQGRSGPASSQVDEANTATLTGENEIVVTATKREQNLRDVPASISALGAGTLQQKAVLNLVDLNATVPGLQISPNNTDIAINLRGIGHTLFSPSAENSVALHLDGVYLSRPAAGLSAFFDVDRVEVLRGPQGSLYGRNATGGAINIISNGPTSTLSGFGSLLVANYKRVDIEGAVGGPIAGDDLTMRIGGYYHRRNDGFGTNLRDGADVDDLSEYGGKAAIKARLGDQLTVTLRGDYYHADDAFGEYHAFGPVRQPFPGAQPLAELLGGTRAPNIRDTNYDTDNRRRMELWGISGEINYKFSDAVSLKSLTAYRRTKTYYQTDVDGTNLPIFSPFFIDSHANQFSEELQLNVKKGPAYLILGGYYFHEKVDSVNFINSYLAGGLPALGIPRILPAPFGVFDQEATLKTNAKAVFGNLDLTLTDRISAGVGLRYSTERKSNRGFNIAFFPNFASYPQTGYDTVDDYRDSSGVTPNANVKYKITETLNVYASISRGFKSGEWISGTSQYARPERVWAYEAGLKGALLDRRLNFSVAGFYYDYTDLQVQRIQTPLSLLENAPGGKLKGVEGEGSLRLPAGFSVDGNFTYLDTKIEGFITQDPNILGTPTRDLTGNRFPFAPKFTYNAGIEKRFDLASLGTGVARFDFQHTSATFLDIFNSTGAAYRPAYAILNASYRQKLSNGLSVLLWAKNLTDKTVKLYEIENQIFNLVVRDPAGAPVPVASTAAGNLNEPRTYGVTVRFDF